MPIQIACRCGRSLRVPDAYVGRRVQCPGCGESHLVAEGQPATADARVVAAAGRPPRRRLVALLALLVLLAGGGWAGWYYWLRPPRQPDANDLALVPANAQAFVTVRLADLWKAPGVEKAVRDATVKAKQHDPLAESPDVVLKNLTWLGPEDVERLSLVVMDADAEAGWVVLRTVRPYDREQVRARLMDSSEHWHEGRVYYRGHAPRLGTMAVYFAAPKVLVYGTEEGVKRCLTIAAGAPPAGPLRPLIDQARSTHTLVGGYVAQPKLVEALRADPQTAVLAGVRQVAVFAQVDQQASLEVRVRMKEAAAAAALKETINGQIGQLRLMAMGVRVAGEVLETLRLSVDGDEVTATAQADTAGAAAAVAALLPRLPGVPR